MLQNPPALPSSTTSQSAHPSASHYLFPSSRLQTFHLRFFDIYHKSSPPSSFNRPLPIQRMANRQPGKRLPYITADAKAQYIRELFDRALPRPGVTSSLVRHPRVHMFVRRHTPLPFTPLGTPPRSKLSSQGVAIKRRRVVVNCLGPVRRKRRPVRFHPYKLFQA
ncbi:hypothetical protein PGTUg99_022728 [Puccinia graminis f. sp. tritici]|uniref:Uncharacterized protein n=1 Tax=Puccinia graminis f. sp. tritici TaxID=56615 RepID=A0A5B0QH39_PUCGR|nr:hypothetical protein PGTUg99_022728 [Puccinia graminis f. sp. tritici]